MISAAYGYVMALPWAFVGWPAPMLCVARRIPRVCVASYDVPLSIAREQGRRRASQDGAVSAVAR